jgi:cysteine desulfuration protein SufE
VKTLQERADHMVKEFDALKDWEDRYKKVIQMGKAWGDLPDEKKSEEAKVKGCQSQVWLHAHLSEDQKVQFQGDSDALLVKGLVAVLLSVYSNSTPEEILKSSPDFLKRLGFEAHLSPSRANGLFAMLKQIRHFAFAFQVQLSMKR